MNWLILIFTRKNRVLPLYRIRNDFMLPVMLLDDVTNKFTK